MDLIGREPENRRLRAFVGRIAEGTGDALLLSGDPGVGKTSLLDFTAALATDSGIRLLRATGSQYEADISYAALHQLLHQWFDELPRLNPLHAEALKVALGLGDGSPPAPFLVGSAVLALLREAAKGQPVLLIVDDLPWLDHASALVLGMVARRLAGLPVALLAACRTGEASFFDQGDLPVVRVEPLSEEAATQLLISRYPVMTSRVRRRLLDTALGNPLALLELPGSLGDLASTVAGTLPAALPLSSRLQKVFASRVRALPAPDYELLLLAALDGTGDLRLIEAIAADRDGLCLCSVERDGLVRIDESAGQLTFRHPLIRSAIVELSTGMQRRRAHTELAARLVGQPERHAWHLAEATVEPDEQVAALLQEVAHGNLRRGDSVGAVAELVRAAELSPSGKDRSARLAEAAYLGSIVTGDLRDAPRLLEQARRAHPGPGGPLQAAVAGAYLLLHGDGDVDNAHRLLATAVRELDNPRDAHDKVLIEALYTLIMICFFGGRAELWPPLQDTIDRLTPRSPELLAIVSRTLSDPARLTPAMLARADASVEGLGQQINPARVTRTGIAVAYLDRLHECREPLQRAIQHGREGGAVTSAIEALFLLGQDAFHMGRWDEAQPLIDEGLQLCRSHGYALLAWNGRLIAALIAAARGDFQKATDTARDMDAWAAPGAPKSSEPTRRISAVSPPSVKTTSRPPSTTPPPSARPGSSPPTRHMPCGFSTTLLRPPCIPVATRRPPPTSTPPANAVSTGSPGGCAWSSWPARPSPSPKLTPPPSNRQSRHQATSAGHSTWPASNSRTVPTCGASNELPMPATSSQTRGKSFSGSEQPLGRPARTVSCGQPASLSPRPTPASHPSPRNSARSPCSRRQAIQTRRSPPASSSPRERSPPTSTRSSPNSASPPEPPCATHSPTLKHPPNEMTHPASITPSPGPNSEHSRQMRPS